MSFFEDLSRRRVFRTAAIYAAVAWGLTEASTFILDRFGFPEWLGTLIIVAFLVGFPIAMYLAWVFDVTPQGIRRTEPTSLRGRMHVLSAITMLIIGTAGLFFLIDPRRAPEAKPGVTRLPADTIAVLPFANATGDPSSAYFAEGVAETLLHQLSRTKALRVTARDSSFSLRDPDMDAMEKARLLNAGFMLDGSVQRAGDVVRIIARLIDGSSGEYVWSESYDGAIADVFNMQDAISNAVITSLRPRIDLNIDIDVPTRLTESNDAFDHYLQGLYAFNRRTPQALEMAIGHFSDAIELDPDFALAYVGRANSNAILSGFGLVSGHKEQAVFIRSEAMEYFVPDLVRKVATTLPLKIADDIRMALQLRPDLAETRTASGLLYLIQRQFALAETELRQAIELNPSYAFAQHMLGLLMREMERFDESLAILETALALDSLSYTLRLDVSIAYGYVGDVERGIAQSEILVAAEPDRYAALYTIGLIMAFNGRYVKAMEIFLDMRDWPDVEAEVFCHPLIWLYFQLGDSDSIQQAESEAMAALEVAGLPWCMEKLYNDMWRSSAINRQGNFREVLAHLEQSIADQTYPEWALPALEPVLGRYALAIGEYEKSLEYFESAARSHAGFDWPFSIFWLENNFAYLDAVDIALAYRKLGNEDQASEIVEKVFGWLEQIETNGLDLPTLLVIHAKAHALRGEHDKAIEFLTEYSWTPGALTGGIVNNPIFEGIKKHPDFLAVLARIDAKNEIAIAEIDEHLDARDAQSR